MIVDYFNARDLSPGHFLISTAVTNKQNSFTRELLLPPLAYYHGLSTPPASRHILANSSMVKCLSISHTCQNWKGYSPVEVSRALNLFCRRACCAGGSGCRRES